MSEPRLIAIVLTRNEEQHLPGCLTSLRPLGAPVLVLDSGSTDRTCELARAAGAQVERRAFDGYANQRNAALALALDLAPGAAWALFVDADERLTPALTAELTRVIATAQLDPAGYWIPRRNIVFGRTLRGGGWWPDYQARLLRLGRARYDVARQVHETVLFDGPTGKLRAPMLHYNYATRREFIAKQRAYTRRRVTQARTAGLRPRRRAYLGMPLRELYRRFVRLHGYRDGLTGFLLAAVLAWEELRAVWLLRREGRNR
jgi:glycosyltransferase involved in cell wall biosynthesis